MARYRDAIEWIAYNDDMEWLDEDNALEIMCVTAVLVRDLFNKDDATVLADLKKAVARMDAQNEREERRYS